MATHYDVLGVGRRASTDEIQQAYRRLALLHHPDVAPDADPARMAAINGAWDVLGDPARRHAYDRALGTAEPPPGPAPRPDPGWQPLADSDDEDWQADLLDDEPVRPAPPRRPSDVLVMVPVVLVGLAVALFFFSTMSGSTGLRTMSMLLMPVSGVGFVAAPLFVMVRSRDRSGD
jgi:hypothetical protein